MNKKAVPSWMNIISGQIVITLLHRKQRIAIFDREFNDMNSYMYV